MYSVEQLPFYFLPAIRAKMGREITPVEAPQPTPRTITDNFFTRSSPPEHPPPPPPRFAPIDDRMEYYKKYGFTTITQTEQGIPCIDPVCRCCALYVSTRTNTTYPNGEGGVYNQFYYLIGRWIDGVPEYELANATDPENDYWVPVCEVCYDGYKYEDSLDNRVDVLLYNHDMFTIRAIEPCECMTL